MPPFEITHEVGPRACVVRLFGDVDIAVVPELRSGLDVALSGGCDNIVLDLTEVTYADSSALGLLVWIDHRLRPSGGRLILAGANNDVGRILELSGLATVSKSIAMSTNVGSALEGLELPPQPTEPLWSEDLLMESDVDKLSTAREQTVGMLAPLGFNDSALFDIKVALGEALANAIRHGKPRDGESPEIVIRVIAYADRVSIEVHDNGSGFDGSHSGGDDLYAPGGRGIIFMRALMDRVEFDRTQSGGTLVRLTKHRTTGSG